MDAPCKICDKCGCGSYHDECQKYMEFRKEQLEKSERRKKMTELRHDISSGYKRMKDRKCSNGIVRSHKK